MAITPISPQVLADMALRDPEMAARYAAQTGQAPPGVPIQPPVPVMKPEIQESPGAALAGPPTPVLKPSLTPPANAAPVPVMKPGLTPPANPAPVPALKPEQTAATAPVDPNQIGALLAGVQGTVPRGQGQAPAPGITGYSGPTGADFFNLIVRNNPQLAAGLAQYLPGQRW